MRLVLQRVSEASVTVDGQVVGSIGKGLLVLCGISEDDDEAASDWACRKLLGIRLWEDDQGKPWAQSVTSSKLGVLLVSQFTLHAQLKGNKPDFHRAMKPDRSRPFWDAFVKKVTNAHKGVPVQTGVFGAKMSVALINDGPVTIELDSAADAAAASQKTCAPAPAASPSTSPPAGTAIALLVRAPGAFALLRALEQRGLRLIALKSTRDAADGGLAVAAALRPAAGGACSAAAVQRMLRGAKEDTDSRPSSAVVLSVSERWQTLFEPGELCTQ